MTTLRRFLVIVALMGWQGGFMFYGAVVVPVLRSTLPHSESGNVTRQVTQWMNLIGSAAVLVMFVDVLASRGAKRWRWVAWLGMALPLVALAWLHGEMSNQMMDPGFSHADPHAFLSWHRAYLLTNTFQWVAGMAFVVLSLRAWRAEDAARTRIV
jgi:hypothetical protein